MKNNRFHNLILMVFIISIISVTFGCKNSDKHKGEEAITNTDISKEESLYRPNFHFTPKANWMNDPNGMFYLNGAYHLYFQYYPDGNVWGPMHWGHAISKDMITWEEQPIALYPDELGMIFSGSAVVDKNNTTGFGKDGNVPIVAIYTYHNMQGEKDGKIDFQTQAIAYSLDEGMTWTKYEANPVISNPGIKDFRDPKVIWDDSSSKWIMSLAAGKKIMFYSSLNLIDWTFESEFGNGIGAQNGVWECPDLFPITIEGTEDTKWVLLVSINPDGPNGGSATQYFIGDFDGKTFVLDESFSKQLQQQKAVWIDYGRDNYAGVTWSNIPESDGRKLFIGWMSNWDYARDVPTYTWRSSMTVARELKLKKHFTNFCLQSLPVKELFDYADKSIVEDSLSINNFNELLNMSKINLANSNIQFELKNLKEEIYKFLFFNEVGDTLKLGLDNKTNEFFINRKKSGEVNFSEKFADTISIAKITNSLNELSVQILLDKTSVEVFYNEGEIVMTELFFPRAPLSMFTISSIDKTFKIENMNIQEFNFN
ncbi:MAG: glycoside hydrolase family 32 protein [Flaviramulus sp.]|nr:glycoside hydrolase family 32 protein [Flaviramulus sp.]NNC49715.1 glycoside hydrolase family 32 protein [Flaviramulus sp.]